MYNLYMCVRACFERSDRLFLIGSGETFTSNASILRYLARAAPGLGFYGKSIMDRTEVCNYANTSLQVFIGL